ncbi:reverse transcriptase domain-containing protein [Tanacetum coccineum]
MVFVGTVITKISTPHVSRLWSIQLVTVVLTRRPIRSDYWSDLCFYFHKFTELDKSTLIQAGISGGLRGVTAALAARDADRNTNGDDSHISGTGVRRTERTARECIYTDFLKCQPLNFKGTEADLKVKGTDLSSYTQRFQELALLCGRMFPKESGKIEKYVGGLPDMIHGSVVASKPKTMQEVVEIATEPMDKKIHTFVDRTGEKKLYGDLNPYALSAIITTMVRVLPKCTVQSSWPSGSWIARFLLIGNNANNPKGSLNANNQKGTGSGQKPTCYECGVQGHFKRECPKLKNNNNRGNQVGGGNAPAKVYAVGHAGTNPDSNVVTGTFLLNNRYASILFDTGADRSFVSTAFSSQIDITPTALDHYYDVELADGRIIGLNTILRGCTLNILNHPFNIDLMPVELGSFDAIIGMDWLVKYQAIIVCAEKIVRIPWGNETLIVHGD